MNPCLFVVKNKLMALYLLMLAAHLAHVFEEIWAHRLAMIYASIMILNGIGHMIGILVTGKYFDGFAGGFTGIALFIFGILMLNSLRQTAAH